MNNSKILEGIEGDRYKLRGKALYIISEVLEKPFPKPVNARRDLLAPPPLHIFEGLEPLGFGLSQDDFGIFDPDDINSPELVWPIKVGVIADQKGCLGEDNIPCGESLLAMDQLKTVNPQNVRGVVSKFSKYMVRFDTGQVFKSIGKMETASTIFSWVGGMWVDARINPVLNVEESHRKVNLLISLALKQRYEWAVTFRISNSPSIRFDTDPTGIKELFRFRDLPEGKNRRDTLINWIEAHWRRNRKDHEVENYVTKHFRGYQKFMWGGFECCILPSGFDWDQRQKFIEMRQSMKELGTDKRRKVM